MRLKAISKFFCRGHEYVVNEIFDIDDQKGSVLIVQKFAVGVTSENGQVELSADHSEPIADAPREDGDLAPAPAVKKSKKKKGR